MRRQLSEVCRVLWWAAQRAAVSERGQRKDKAESPEFTVSAALAEMN